MDAAKTPRPLPLGGGGPFLLLGEGKLEKRGEGDPLGEQTTRLAEQAAAASPYPSGLSASVASLPAAQTPEALPHKVGGGVLASSAVVSRELATYLLKRFGQLVLIVF